MTIVAIIVTMMCLLVTMQQNSKRGPSRLKTIKAAGRSMNGLSRQSALSQR
jgi:hypothetical protein